MTTNSGSRFDAAFGGFARRILLLGCLTLTLAACGGGGGGSEPPPTTPPPGGGSPVDPPRSPAQTDEQRAQNARVRMMQIGSELAISWLDTFDDELGYEVQRKIGDGDWQAQEALPAVEGGIIQWQRLADTSARYRVVVRLEGSSLPLYVAPNVSEIAIAFSPTPLSIQIAQPEPVHGNVEVSMPDAAPALSVTYYLDNAQVTKVSNDTFAASLPPQHLVRGLRFMHAIVEKSPGHFILGTRTLQVDNPDLAVLLTYTPPRNAGDPFALTARASSDEGITSVEFFVNGASVGASFPISGLYTYSADPATLPSGTNVFRVVATDGTTATVSMETQITLDQFPSLNVTGPFDGMITGGNLNIQGNFGDDAAGATLTLSLGDQRILRTQTSPFAVNHSLAAIAAGEHTLMARVVDASGRVKSLNYQIIVPSTSLQYELVATDAAELLAADRGALLYEKNSGEVVLRNAAGVETTGPTNVGMSRFWLSDGRVLAQGLDQHVYVFDSSGQPTDLTPQNSLVPNIEPTVRDEWVSWAPIGTPTQLAAYNVRTGHLSMVTIDGRTAALTRHDIITTPGHEQLVFPASINGLGGIYRHTLATNSTQLVRTGSHGDVRTDGTRLAWLHQGNLVTAPLDNPTASTNVTNGFAYYLLEDGVFCWLDNASTVNVSDGVTTTQLGALATMRDYMLKDGHAIFANRGKTHTWNRTSGARLLVDTVVPAIQSNGVAYFLTGTSGTLYRVTLP